MLCSVVAVTTRLVGAVGGVRSRTLWADRTGDPNTMVSARIRTAVDNEGNVLVIVFLSAIQYRAEWLAVVRTQHWRCDE
jgi:hypothetical protein